MDEVENQGGTLITFAEKAAKTERKRKQNTLKWQDKRKKDRLDKRLAKKKEAERKKKIQ